MLKTISLTSLSVALAVMFFTGTATLSTAQAATKYCNGPKITWRVSLWGKRRAVTEGIEYASKAIKDATCGNFNLKLYYGEQLSKAKENLDALKVGAIEMAMVCSSYSPGKLRAATVLDLPFLPVKSGDWKTMRKVYDTLWKRPELIKSLAKWNSRRYIQNLLPMYEYMGRGKPPKDLADFKHKRLRALGGMGESARAIGAVPTTMPASETYTALQRGTVDAIGFPFTYTFHAYKLDEISTWYTSNLAAGNVDCFMAMRRDAYKKLPKQYKQIMEETKDGAYDAMIEAYAAKDKVNLANWRKNPKLTEVRFSEADLDKFREKGGKPVWEEWVKENKQYVPTAQQLIDLVLKTCKEGSKGGKG
jgi:TRAP-type C4-dicarboxylate transport system substrate-binding protein